MYCLCTPQAPHQHNTDRLSTGSTRHRYLRTCGKQQVPNVCSNRTLQKLSGVCCASLRQPLIHVRASQWIIKSQAAIMLVLPNLQWGQEDAERQGCSFARKWRDDGVGWLLTWHCCLAWVLGCTVWTWRTSCWWNLDNHVDVNVLFISTLGKRNERTDENKGR